MASLIQYIGKRLPWTLTLKVVLVLVVAVSGASITISQSRYQSEMGGTVNIANQVTLTDKGFATNTIGMATTGNCPSANVTFGITPGNANTALTMNDWSFDAQVATTGSTPALSCFTVSLTITPSGSSPTTYTVKIASGATITTGQTIDVKFDIGASLPTPPFTFLAKVA